MTKHVNPWQGYDVVRQIKLDAFFNLAKSVCKVSFLIGVSNLFLIII